MGGSRLCCSHWEVCVIIRTMFAASITAVAAALFAHVVVADSPGISISASGISISQGDVVAFASIIAVLLAPCVGLLAMVIAKHFKVLGAWMLLIVVAAILFVVTAVPDIVNYLCWFFEMPKPDLIFWNLTTA